MNWVDKNIQIKAKKTKAWYIKTVQLMAEITKQNKTEHYVMIYSVYMKNTE